MSGTLKHMIMGFVAAALSVLIFHQGMSYLLGQWGWGSGNAWSMAPVPPYGVPRLGNAMFWGGLYGILFGLIADKIPGGAYPVRGFLFGLVFTTILGSWIIVALIKGRPILNGFLENYDVTRLRNGFLLNAVAFGIGLGLLYPLLTGRRTTS